MIREWLLSPVVIELRLIRKHLDTIDCRLQLIEAKVGPSSADAAQVAAMTAELKARTKSLADAVAAASQPTTP